MRYFIDISYKGTNYHGWQIQENAHTVQAELNNALKTVLRTEVETMGSGRTDTGVHAIQQIVHCDIEVEPDLFQLKGSLNGVLPDDVTVNDIYKVSEDAHSRFDATKRSYIYKIKTTPSPFEKDEYYLYKREVNLGKMNEAARSLLEYEDFEAFSKTNTDVKTFNCKIVRAEWVNTESGMEFHISADRFLRGMVRAIVGTLLDVGTGKKTIEQFKLIIESKDRKNASESAPAQGLFLSEVKY